MDINEFNSKLSEALAKPPDQLAEADAEILFLERRHCAKSFVNFLKYCKIVEAPIPGQTGGGIISFTITPHLKEVINTLLTERLISILKARQIYLSTTLADYVLWYALFHVGANVLLFSKGLPESKELLAKSIRAWEQLPPFLKAKRMPDSTEEMGFPSVKSSIKAFPSTKSAGISYTGSILIYDEHAEHEYAEENYLSAKPTIDRGAQCISVFTEDAWNKDNLATAIFEDARKGKNGFKALFFPYDVVPGRGGDWYERKLREIPERELKGLTPELYMRKNYPRSIEEALSVPSTVAAFDKNVLDEMDKEALNFNKITILNSEVELDYRYINIYIPYRMGDSYIAGTDTAEGVGRDYNITTILNTKTGVVCADIMDNKLNPDDLAYHSVQLLKAYKNPLWWIESKLWGKEVIKKALELGYRNFGYRDKLRTKIGFETSESNRIELYGVLISEVNGRQIKLFNRAGITQFRDVIKNADKNGRVEARSQGHDDYPIALGLCVLKKNEVVSGDWGGKPIETLHFDDRPEDDLFDRVKELKEHRETVEAE